MTGSLLFCSLQKPAFAHRSHTDELSEFLQQCRETPALDIFSSEQSIDVAAAMVSEGVREGGREGGTDGRTEGGREGGRGSGYVSLKSVHSKRQGVQGYCISSHVCIDIHM